MPHLVQWDSHDQTVQLVKIAHRYPLLIISAACKYSRIPLSLSKREAEDMEISVSVRFDTGVFESDTLN